MFGGALAKVLNVDDLDLGPGNNPSTTLEDGVKEDVASQRVLGLEKRSMEGQKWGVVRIRRVGDQLCAAEMICKVDLGKCELTTVEMNEFGSKVLEILAEMERVFRGKGRQLDELCRAVYEQRLLAEPAAAVESVVKNMGPNSSFEESVAMIQNEGREDAPGYRNVQQLCEEDFTVSSLPYCSS